MINWKLIYMLFNLLISCNRNNEANDIIKKNSYFQGKFWKKMLQLLVEKKIKFNIILKQTIVNEKKINALEKEPDGYKN